MSDKVKLSTENYKGVRDFYPEDLFIQKHIYKTWRTVAESFGYIEYDASILEPAELYKAKSGEEIVNEQTYTFTDRGDREVTLRPEMTPTVARLVAAKEKELVFPLRWYSIPNLFRYEKPQKGRLREHWQLNVDLFGIDSDSADAEIVTIAHRIMTTFGAKNEDFVIKVNSRKIMKALYDKFELAEENSYKLSKIIDKKNKISNEVFETSVTEIIGERAKDFISLLGSNEKLLLSLGENNADTKNLVSLIDMLQKSGVTNVEFDPTLMRGFDYYTGVVFEVFDNHPDNNRSIFGGGRYDDLLDIFDSRKIPAVGFGAGDVTMRDFLETHGLLPKFVPPTQLYICIASENVREFANDTVIRGLRDDGINIAVDLSGKKIGDQIKYASKLYIPYILVIGEDEQKSGFFSVKNLETGEETRCDVTEIPAILKK